MSSIKISELNELQVVSSDDFFVVVDSGSLTTYRATVNTSVGNWISNSGSALVSISSSWASSSISSSYSNTSSFLIYPNSSTSSYSIYSLNALTSSHALTSVESSHSIFSETASYLNIPENGSPFSASWASSSLSSSFSQYAKISNSSSWASSSVSSSHAETASYFNVGAGGFIPGMVMTFARQTAPSGWLICSGSTLLISDYLDLASAIYVGDSLNTASHYGYKSSDSSGLIRDTLGSYITLPDLRGMFVRGFSYSKPTTNIYHQTDSSRIWATEQSGSIGAHAHTVNASTAVERGSGPLVAASYATVGVPGNAPSENQGVVEVGSNNGGLETVPRNVTLMYCIKT